MSLGVFCYTSPRLARAILDLVLLSSVLTNLPSKFARMSRHTLESGRTSSWYDMQQTAKSSYSGWSRRGTRGNPAECEGRYTHWDEGRSHDSAKDTEGDAAEGRDKNRGDAGKEDDGENAQAPKVSAPVPANVTDVETTQKKLWELQRLLNNGKGSLSSTYMKNTEANTKACDLDQMTMQALDTLAGECEIFEESMKKVTLVTEEGDMLYAVGYEVGEELDRAQKDQERAGVHVRGYGHRLQGVHKLLGPAQCSVRQR